MASWGLVPAAAAAAEEEGTTSSFNVFRMGLLLLLLCIVQYRLHIRYVLLIVPQAFAALRRKQEIGSNSRVPSANSSSHLPQQQQPQETSWEEPPETLPYQKIIWAFWHTGQENLPGFCQLALQSWKVRNPSWTIVILNQDNYKQYVSKSDLPSTFATLKVQHQSDVLRLAVLRRYGGLYLDASYVLVTGLDDLWQQAYEGNDLYLTSLITLQHHPNVAFPNNCFLLAPRPQNPVICAWQQLTLRYLEQPALTVPEIDTHPHLQRVKHHRFDPAFGMWNVLAAYFGVLWALTDVLYYEPSVKEYVRNHVYILPTYRWTFDFLMVEMLNMTDKEIYTKTCQSQSFWVWLPRLPKAVDVNFSDNPALAERLLSLGNAFKVSSDLSLDFHEPVDYHLSRPSTLGRILRAAVDTSVLPIRQADTGGAYRVQPF